MAERCCVHKLRNLERKAPKHALAEIRDDFHRIVYAANADTADWVAQSDPTRRKQIAEEIQKFAYDDVPYALWGEFVTPAATRKNVRGMLTFDAPLLWNISLES